VAPQSVGMKLDQDKERGIMQSSKSNTANR